MEQQYGKLSMVRLCRKQDSRILTAQFLIDNQEYAFKAWRSAPDYVSRKFEDFCEYVLPYRAGNEKPEIYRERYLKKYSLLCDTTKAGPECLIKAFHLEFWYNQHYRNSNTLWKYPISLPISKMEQG